MKTKYIEGTDKQYSIREDGEVILNYKRNRFGGISSVICGNPIKKFRKNVSLRIKGRKNNLTVTIPSLLKKHFKFYYCSICNKKVNDDSLYSHKCKNCIKENLKQYNKNTESKYAELRKEFSKKSRDSLSNYYICGSVLRTPVKDTPLELIELKRNQMLLKRELNK